MRDSLNQELSDAEQRIKWRRGLSELDLRALATDHLMGRCDESTADAYEEYLLRYPENTSTKSQASRKSKRARTAR